MFAASSTVCHPNTVLVRFLFPLHCNARLHWPTLARLGSALRRTRHQLRLSGWTNLVLTALVTSSWKYRARSWAKVQHEARRVCKQQRRLHRRGKYAAVVAPSWQWRLSGSRTGSLSKLVIGMPPFEESCSKQSNAQVEADNSCCNYSPFNTLCSIFTVPRRG